MKPSLSFLFIGVFIFSLIVFTSCNKKTEISHLPGKEYAPLTVGNYWVYDVEKRIYNGNYDYDDSTIYPGPSYSDTFMYQVKEELTSLEQDLEGQDYYTLTRYIRNDPSDNWTKDSVWVSKYVGNQFVRIENNISFVKLKFPVQIGQEWDGNQYNSIVKDLNTEPCEYSRIQSTLDYAYGLNHFSEAIQVLHYCNDQDSVIRRHYETEYYARDVGMVYRLLEKYDYCQGTSDRDTLIAYDTLITSSDTLITADTTFRDSSSCNKRLIIDNGIVLEMNLVDYKVISLE